MRYQANSLLRSFVTKGRWIIWSRGNI